MRPLRRFLVVAALAGCGSSPAGPDAGDAGAPPDFAPPPDLAPAPDLVVATPILPQLDPHSNVVLSKVQLITITFNGYNYKNVAEAWGDFVVTSSWYKTVGADYGVGPGVHLKKVVLPDDPGIGMTDAQVVDLLRMRIADQTLPPPPSLAKDDQYLYMVYFPAKTAITQPDGSASCSTFGGYHGSASVANAGKMAYAVIADCGGGTDDLTRFASHELIEAATDPFRAGGGSYYVDPSDPTDPWQVERFQEVGDMCQFQSIGYENGFALQPIWSNSAAAALKDPCVPSAAPDKYYTVTAIPADLQNVAAGQKAYWVLTGWAPTAVPGWSIKVGNATFSPYAATDLQPVLTRTTISRGASVTLSLKAPANAQSGEVAGVEILSGPDNHREVVAFQVQ